MATEDADAAIQYAGCQAKHAEVTGLYQYWRQKIIDFKNELLAKEEDR